MIILAEVRTNIVRYSIDFNYPINRTMESIEKSFNTYGHIHRISGIHIISIDLHVLLPPPPAPILIIQAIRDLTLRRLQTPDLTLRRRHLLQAMDALRIRQTGEQPEGIVAAHIDIVALVHDGADMLIPPDATVGDRLERVVDGEQDRACADLGHGALQRRRAEVARRGDEDLRAEVVPDQTVLAHGHVGETGPVELVVDPVEVVRAGECLSY
ncbi:hypothetical protein VTN96DRAFT_1162 [Rasamsonia emersonii]